MAHSDILGQEYGYFGGIGNVHGMSTLPPQFIPKKHKTPAWEKANLDSLETEGLKQYVENLKYLDYYKMMSGQMVYKDVVGEDVDVLFQYTQQAKEELNINSSLRHWDLMYPVVSRLTGEWSDTEDKFRFDSTDDASTNDYIRERSIRLDKYVKAKFQDDLNKALLLAGYDVKQDFASEEEYNQYNAQLQQIQYDYFPDNIDGDMKKNFKTECAVWSEKTWERDYERFRMRKLENMEARDILLTGKCFRHYRIGYDYYYPEYWSPIEVFHSKEASLDRAEDAEYIGRIKFYSLNEFFINYGHLISEKDKKKIMKSYYGEAYYKSFLTKGGLNNFGDGLFTRVDVPFEGYHDHKLAKEWESVTGIPQSEIEDVETGETKSMFSIPVEHSKASAYASHLARALRTEFDVRLDTIQTTEVYWKGFKAIGILSVLKENGYIETFEIDEDILPEYLKEFNIKNLKNVSLQEYEKLSDKERANTVVWSEVPILYKGIKARLTIEDDKDKINHDFYHVEELDFKIKGAKGNIFDIKSPVCGHIGESFCEKIRAEQITYNYLLNQNQSYLEKEIGSFFVIDVNSLPTNFFDLGEEEDVLVNLRNLAKATGLLPTDFGRNNVNQNGGGMIFNPMSYQNATYTDQLQRNLQMAQTYKMMAYEKIGLTPQRMGSPDKYMNSQGISLGQEASYAQTYGIEQLLLENKRANIEIHIAIAQHCQINNLDANYVYMASNNELDFIASIKDDPEFPNRIINVRPINSPKKQRELQELKNILVSNNTMGNDILALTEVILADDYLTLKEVAKKNREYMEKQQQAQMDNDRQIAKEQLEQEERHHQEKLTLEKYEIDAKIKSSELQALGRAGSAKDNPTDLDYIKQSSEEYLSNKELDNKNNIELQRLKEQATTSAKNLDLQAEKIAIEREKQNIERERLATQRYVADAKNKDSIINKN